MAASSTDQYLERDQQDASGQALHKPALFKRSIQTHRPSSPARALKHIAAALALAASAAADAADTKLLGCWRAERVDHTLADGRLWTDIGGCTLWFDADHITSACALRAGNLPIRYTYSITAPGTYRARIEEHPAQPRAVGSERDYSYRVEGDRLFITTFPQSALPVPTSRAERVDSMSVKVGSQTDLENRSGREKAGCEGRLVRGDDAAVLATAVLSR